jgi:hypothetical protein
LDQQELPDRDADEHNETVATAFESPSSIEEDTETKQWRCAKAFKHEGACDNERPPRQI